MAEETNGSGGGGKGYVDPTVRVAESVEKGAGRTIVAAVDESSHAEEVFKFVCNNFDSPDTKAVFVYVAKEFDSLWSTTMPKSHKSSEVEGKKALVESWVNKAKELKLKFVCEGHVLVGDAREQLVLFCDTLKPDTLVMGSHGMGTLKRALIGSVSNYCVQHCSCPVTVVRKPREEAAKSPSITSFLKNVTKRFMREKPEKTEEAAKEQQEQGQDKAAAAGAETGAPPASGTPVAQPTGGVGASAPSQQAVPDAAATKAQGPSGMQSEGTEVVSPAGGSGA